LREDSLKRFYFFGEFVTADSLLYDFNLTTGDTLQNTLSNWGCNNPPMTVTSVNTVYLGTTPLNKFNLSYQAPFYKSLYEGIGGSGGLFRTSSLCEFIESGSCLIAYKKGNDSLYINCGLEATIIFESPDSNNYINLFPNPATTSFTIYPEYSGRFTISEIEIYNTMGEKRLTVSAGSTHRPTLSKGEGVRVDVSSLPAGVYFVAVTYDKGNKITRKFIKL
jgi:hypothetical protein